MVCLVQIRAREVFFLLILSTGLLNHVIIIPFLLDVAGRDAWLSVLISIVPYVLFMIMILFISRGTEQKKITIWIQEKFNGVLSKIIIAPFLFLLFINSYITIVDTTKWLSTYFLKEMSNFVIVIILVFSCFIISMLGLTRMILMSLIILPLVVILGFFIMGVNITEKDIHNLFPLLLNGYGPLVKGIIFASSGLLELYMVLLVQHHIREPIKFRSIFILGMIFIGLMFGPLSASIMEFGPVEAANLRFPAYEEWRLLQIGEYISKLDFLAMYQWMSGALIRIGLSMFLINEFINKKKNKYILPVFYIILLCVSLIPIDAVQFTRLVHFFYFPINVVVILLMITILSIFIMVSKKRGEKYDQKT